MGRKKSKMEIYDTAFWTAASRASLENISKDIYAKYWLNEDSKRRHEQYIKQVDSFENLLLSLRNRFFLEQMKEFFDENPNASLINIGAGLTSYPFLLDEKRKYYEVDCEEIVEIKKKKIKEFPKRKITFISADLNDINEIEKLFSFLEEGKSFVLLEGLIYYLKKQNVDKLLELIDKIQSSGSRLGIVSWPPALKQRPVFKRFKQFVSKTLDEDNKYIFHESKEFVNLKNYSLVKQTDYYQLSKEYGQELNKDDDFLWEDLFVLEKE